MKFARALWIRLFVLSGIYLTYLVYVCGLLERKLYHINLAIKRRGHIERSPFLFQFVIVDIRKRLFEGSRAAQSANQALANRLGYEFTLSRFAQTDCRRSRDIRTIQRVS